MTSPTLVIARLLQGIGAAIGLFVVAIVGIFDFLKTIEVARADPNWATPVTSATGYVFAALVYFVCCYAMSRYATGIEKRLSTGERR